MARKKADLDRFMKFIFEIGTLRKVVRSHKQVLLTDDLSDNIASHSYRVAMIGYLLATLENVNINKVVLMCLTHDLPEARSGDQNWIYKRYTKIFEEEIIDAQLNDLTPDNELYKLAQEYNERKTQESKIAKDADLLDQILLLREYSHIGNKEAKSWLNMKGLSEQEKQMFSKSAKTLAKMIKVNKPHCWWNNLWTHKRRN